MFTGPSSYYWRNTVPVAKKFAPLAARVATRTLSGLNLFKCICVQQQLLAAAAATSRCRKRPVSSLVARNLWKTVTAFLDIVAKAPTKTAIAAAVLMVDLTLNRDKNEGSENSVPFSKHTCFSHYVCYQSHPPCAWSGRATSQLHPAATFLPPRSPPLDDFDIWSRGALPISSVLPALLNEDSPAVLEKEHMSDMQRFVQTIIEEPKMASRLPQLGLAR